MISLALFLCRVAAFSKETENCKAPNHPHTHVFLYILRRLQMCIIKCSTDSIPLFIVQMLFTQKNDNSQKYFNFLQLIP